MGRKIMSEYKNNTEREEAYAKAIIKEIASELDLDQVLTRAASATGYHFNRELVKICLEVNSLRKEVNKLKKQLKKASDDE